MSHWDAFGDVLEGTKGIFGASEGLDAYESCQHQHDRDGLMVQCHCETCGKLRQVTISWPELIALKFNVSPAEAYGQVPQLQQFATQWANTAQAMAKGVPYAWYPIGMDCPNCPGRRGVREFRRPLISPGECEAHLREGRRIGALPQNLEFPLMQQAKAVATRLGRLG